MNEIKVKKEDFGDCMAEGDCKEFEFVEKGEWIDEGKYQYQETIVRRKSDGTFWRCIEQRSGSYFSDYHYASGFADKYELVQVEQVEVAVTRWEIV